MTGIESWPQWENSFVLPLRECTSPEQAGVKASTLCRLLAAGFPVPDGIVVTSAAFSAHLSQGSVAAAGPERVQPAILESPLPPPVAEALCAALAHLGDVALAVRSSGLAEDLAGASYAGQYETVLGVRGCAAIADAVRTCWASGFSRHVREYQRSRDLAAGGLAVLIQPLVAASAAGVAFTANPVTGDRFETVVNAVRGLGDRLVSGQATPDEWVVRDGRGICRSAPEGALGEKEAQAVAELARRVEAHFGAPQDVEWALSGGQLYLLQARPITTLPAGGVQPGPVEPPYGFWQRGDSHYPQPLFPLTRSVLLSAANQGFRRMCAEFGLLWETVEEREIGGWVYLRGVPLGGKDRRPPPDWLLRLLIMLTPSLRSRVQGCVEAARADKAGKWIERWDAELRVNLAGRLQAFRDADLKALSDDGLDNHTEALIHLLHESQGIHMMLNQSLNLLLAEFAFTCRDQLGWEEEKAFALLSGLSETSSAPARALARMAQRVRENPVLAELLRENGRQTVDRMSSADSVFGSAYEEYEREFGHRAIRYELADPTLAETPGLILSLISDQLRRGYNPDGDAQELADGRARLAEEARRSLAGSPAEETKFFQRLLPRAERAYAVREEHGFHDTSMPLALLRYTAMEIGRRLADRRQIRQQGDILFLDVGEARAALLGGDPQHERVERRKQERYGVLSRPGPAYYGTPPPSPPSFAALPAEARFIHEAVLWFSERVFAMAASGQRQSNAGILKGIAASAGRYTGVVRVIRDESEFARIQAGDVLVCPITSPVWSMLFPSVGALVTDTGGFLSHSAIIAREYRLPAVVATGNATRLLHDGQIVTVDGTAGTIVLEEHQ